MLTPCLIPAASREDDTPHGDARVSEVPSFGGPARAMRAEARDCFPAVLFRAIVFLLLALPLRAAERAPKPQQLTSPDQVPEGLAKSDWQSIRAAYEAGLHAFMPIEGGWQARNPGQQWTTKFDSRGFIAQPRGADWQWGLELKGYGFPGAERAIAGVPVVKAEGQRLSYDWDAALQEWWVNDARGLEHGFTVKTRPEAAPSLNSQPSTLNFLLGVRGTLTPHITADALGVEFRDARGATVLTYAGLKVWDADGKVLRSRFEASDSQLSTSNSQPTLRLLVEEHGARYPLTIDPIAQQAYLKPAAVGTTQLNDAFGFSVAVSGDTVVVGATGEDSSTTGVNSTPNESSFNSGAAYVFVRSGMVWTQQAYLKPAAVGSTQSQDFFGYSVAVSGDTVVVGAYSEDSSTTGVNSTPNESGLSSGAAYIFVRSGTVWTQQAYLKPAAVGTTQQLDRFGISVAVSGETVVVGANGEDSSTTGVNTTPNESANSAGAAYVFVRSGTVWTQQAYLKPAAVGTTQAGDAFGDKVAVSGDTVIVGAWLENSTTTGVNSTPNDDAPGEDSGAAYIFVRNGTTWTQQAYLKPAAVGTTQFNDNFGWAVAVSGDTAVVGAINEDSSTTGVNSTPNDTLGISGNAGAAYVFVRSGTTWSQQAYLKPAAVGTTQAGDLFGTSVAISGDTVVVGATGEDSITTGVNSTPDESASDAGAAYVFVRSGVVWTQQGYLKPAAVGTTQAGDGFGTVAISGDTVVIGAGSEDSSTTGVNSTPDESSSSGAAYIFTIPAPAPDIAVTQAGPVADGGTVDFGNLLVGSFSAPLTFTITNPGTANLTGLSLSGGTGDFTVGTLNGTSIPVGSGTVTFIVSFNPSVRGLRSTTLQIGSNVMGSKNPYDITLTGTGLTPLENWRQTWYGTTSNTGNAANDADPYLTGVPNLAVFAVFGPNQDPAKVAAGLLPQPQRSDGNYVISFITPFNVSGLSYSAEWRTDLLPGAWTSVPDSGSGMSHTFTVPIGTNAQIFMRLRVITAP